MMTAIVARASSALRAVVIAALAASVVTGACGRRPDDSAWSTEAVRAVVRHIQSVETERRVVVDARQAGGAGGRIPWAIQQALVTAGYVLHEGGAAADTLLVVRLQQPERTADGWRVTTTSVAGDPGAAVTVVWLVRCTGTACTVAAQDTV
jgi:hypothetical protein